MIAVEDRQDTEVACLEKQWTPFPKVSRVACQKFGHPVLSSEFLNYALKTEFVDAVGMLQKI